MHENVGDHAFYCIFKKKILLKKKKTKLQNELQLQKDSRPPNSFVLAKAIDATLCKNIKKNLFRMFFYSTNKKKYLQ